MSSTFLWSNLFPRAEQRDIYTLLRRVPIFESLSRRELHMVERILHRRAYTDGEHIFRAGEQGLGMYIIERGEVQLVAADDGQELTRLGDGEFFGELALFSEQQRSATAVAVGETKVFGFFQPDLQELLETQPKLGVSVVMKLSLILARRLELAVEENRQLRQQLDGGGPTA
jgi:CRP-like cAMP-binding protein